MTEREVLSLEPIATTFDALIVARSLHQLNLRMNVRKPGLDRFVTDLVASIRDRLEDRGR